MFDAKRIIYEAAATAHLSDIPKRKRLLKAFTAIFTSRSRIHRLASRELLAITAMEQAQAELPLSWNAPQTPHDGHHDGGGQ